MAGGIYKRCETAKSWEDDSQLPPGLLLRQMHTALQTAAECALAATAGVDLRLEYNFWDVCGV